VDRTWALASAAAGLASFALAGVVLVFDLGGHDGSEAIAAMVLFAGLFLLGEGAISLWRQARLPVEKNGGKS